MKINKIKLLNYVLKILTVITFTACGGGSSSGTSNNNCNYLRTEDNDNDGFLSHDEFHTDPSESTPFENSKFTNLENVVNSEGIQHILKVAKERGVTINLQLGNNPPKLTGYYKFETGGRVVYANHSLDNRQTGSYIIGEESRVCRSKNYIEEAGTREDKSSFAAIYKLRGDGNHFSEYWLKSYKHSDTCSGYYVYIVSGKVDKNSRDIKNYKVIFASLGYEEKSPNACVLYKDSRRPEEIILTEDHKKITDLDELEYMCVDGDKAYIRDETWKNKAKESCKCTADIEIECE